MTIGGVVIDGYKAINEQALPLGGLVVLFGANSAGKTNVLDAVEFMISPKEAGAEERFAGPGFESDDGYVFVRLEGASIDGHPDRALLEDLFRGRQGSGSEYLLVDPDLRSELGEGATLEEIRAYLAGELAASGPGTDADRELVAGELVSANTLVVDGMNTWLVADAGQLSEQGRLAARRIVDSGISEDDEDALTLTCAAALDGDLVFVESLGDGFFLRSVGNAVRLEHQSDGLETLVEGAIDVADGVLNPVMRVQAEKWLEDGRSWSESILIPSSIDSWFRVRPVLPALGELLARRATDLLPGFLRDQGTVSITVVPPTAWGRTTAKVRVALTELDGEVRPLRSLGAGSARWAAAAVRLACADLVGATWELFDSESPAEELDEAELNRVASAGRLADVARPVWPERIEQVLLVDEPEANLHPAAISSVIDWLQDLAARTNGVLVATHSASFLGLDEDEATMVHVMRTGGQTVLQSVPGNDLSLLDGAVADLGMSRAELMQHTRLALFVEGPHDEILLRRFVGDELQRARVQIIPMHGTHNALALVDSEVLHRLGITIAVFTDNATGSSRSPEEAAIDRLVKEAQIVGRTIHRFGIKRHDILEYLHVDACREIAPAFPGWDDAAASWKDEGGVGPLKKFVTKRYGLRLGRREVARLADRTMALHGPPKEIVREAKRITALASDLHRRRWDPAAAELS